MVDATADGDAVIQQALGNLDEVEQRIQQLFDKVNGLLSWVPSFLPDVVDSIKAGMAELNQKLRQYWDMIEAFIDEPGSPGALTAVAQAWQHNVSTVLGDVAGTLTTGKLQSENDWHGQAANAYKSTIPDQNAALTSVKGTADQINTSLNNIANALTTFWIAVAVALAAFVVGLVTAIVACCTVVGIPAAIGSALGVVTGYLNSVNAEANSLVQKLTDDSDFPGGNWPVSTSDLSDDHGGWQVS